MTIQIIEVRDKIIINEENNTIQIIEQPNKIVISDVGVQGPKGDSGTGIASINGLTNLNQSIVIGASGNDTNIVSATNTHTINIPTSSTTKRGVLSSTDWTAFNSKQSALGFAPENIANKENATLDNSATKYPTNNLVKSQLDLKVGISNTETISGIKTFSSNITITATPTIANHSARIQDVQNSATTITNTIGQNNGIASLGADGKVPANQLPSYVDDVLEYNNLAGFPATGEDGKIYVAKDTNKIYRWSGTQYVEISASLALGETSSTAFAGDKGKTAYDHSQIIAGNPHGTTKAQIGLSDVDNTSDLSKPISTATQSALDNKVDKEAGKSLSTNDYTNLEKSKLAGIQNGATQNQTDAYLLDRTNHTGAQAISTVSGLQSALDNKVDKIGIVGASLGSASKTPSITHNAQGQITFASEQNIQIAQSQVNNLTTDLSTKLNNALLNSKIFVGNASDVATPVTMSGDVTILNTGFTAIGNLKVTNAMLQGSIDNSKLLNNYITINGSPIALGGTVSITNYTAGSGLQLIGNTFFVPTAGISLYQINTIGQYSALANLTNTTANAIATDVVDVVGSGVITVVNGAKSVFGIAGNNLTISIPAATNSVDGYLVATDRTLFNNKFGNQANQFTALTAKSTLVDNDVLVVEDSAAAAYTKKKTLMSDVWTYTSTKTGTFTNKTLSDSTTFFGNVSDVSKKLIFSLGGAVTAKTLTIASAHTLDRTITLPDATDTLVGRDTTDTLTNKSISASQINSGVLSSAQIPQTLSAGTYTVSSGALVVQGIQAGVTTTNPFGYFKYNAYGTFSPGVGSIGINATNRIYTQFEFVVASDERIKNIINKSDSKADLEILKQIQITDYQYKDKLRYGDKIHKKVIAQQIQPIFPQAVSTTTEFVPDIMKMASVSDRNRINLSNTDLVAGDFVRLVRQDDQVDVQVDVQVVAVKEKYFEVKSFLENQIEFSLEDQEVFVYGKSVDNFHIVDYDELTTLAISSIQELHSNIQELNSKLNNFINSKN